MRHTRYFITVCFLLYSLRAYAFDGEEKETVFQTSTIEALIDGMYDGDMTFSRLGLHGDFGIGTFNALDGEMVCLAGGFYQIKGNGAVSPVTGDMKTPFAVMTFFEPDMEQELKDINGIEEVERGIVSLFPSRNIFYAVKITGLFRSMRVRSVRARTRPYPALTEAVKDQSVFEFRDIRGTVVGFWCPDFIKGVNVPGFHFHFISEDRSSGGHLLDCDIARCRLELDYTSGFLMELPGTDDFLKMDLGNEKKAEIHYVEKGAGEEDHD
ncbi:MAG: acetolactate decarboxylase [Candidatus Omnitrophota bacterium]